MIPRRGNYYFIASNAEKDCSKLDMVKDLGSFILLLLLGVSDLTTGLSTTDINACPKHISRKKPDGQIHSVLEMSCCPNFMEVENRCLACPAGYFGQNCSVPCLPGTYGQQCKLECKCTGGKLCDPKAGCKCKAGYSGEKCDKECSTGFYGPSCIYNCKCSETSVCNTKTGECTCDRGWIGKHCDDKCASGYYGFACANRCSCSANHQCNHVTGDCHCETGKQGSHCNETCDAGKYGMGCLKICSCQDCNPEDGVCQPIDNDGISVGIIVGVVVGILVLVVSLFIIVLKCRTNSSDRHQLQQKKRGDCSSNYYEDIDDYAEIPDSKLHPNYPYSYADSNDVKPPIKERIPTTKRKTNQYLSLTEAQRLSKLSSISGELKSHGGSTDYLNPYTGLLKDAKCASYQDINKEKPERKSSSESIQSESGYVKIASGTTAIKDKNSRQCNDYTDAPPSTRYSNGSDLDRLTTESRIEKGISIESGYYLKMNSTLKREAQTEADKRTLNIDDKGSQKNVFLPKITVSSQSGSTETLNIKNQ
ncbi:Multiple epidermal growth factor-like domains protein 11,Multiple epidermal growth factor-like domains protein 6 [Mytilus edulis]|uniref:Multiple epidermal growth factor-like domains protein 11,Multiple epidermal growth factor-like domains protein 6 n=1 Tax=Mytilus edulis TaxID=6550 RepID=A0A8S3PQL4_MYTED|nr:Multiple epidermal growth factor-like domains protein 11,Multiple epidermal growth factor-like domains protein 6 [Mytilus edulis]